MADGPDDDASTAVREAVDVLYGGPPETFLETRKDLSARARSDGDTLAAKAIGALRKPTVAAAVVNRYVHEAPDEVDRLLDVGARLREAHEALDAEQLRELSAERRALVGELTAAALASAGVDAPSAGQRDEVTNTFDAAVADPEIAGRLGRLTRSESWSGFGVAPLSGPALTLVRGGRASSRTAQRTTSRTPAGTASSGRKPEAPEASPEPPRPSAAETRKVARALDKARAAFDEADAALQDAEQAERAASERIREISTQLSDLQRELEERKQDRDRSRRAVKAGRARRREARSALDRAERQADRTR